MITDQNVGLNASEENNISEYAEEGYLYGQLVALGYTEFHVKGQSIKSIGSTNLKYKLIRRDKPNGLKMTKLSASMEYKNSIKYLDVGTSANDNLSRNSEKSFIQSEAHQIFISTASIDSISNSSKVDKEDYVCIEYTKNPDKDIFQIGRLQSIENDFVVRGPLHINDKEKLCGTVSRYACRIECDRIPPYKCHIFAAGFNKSKKLFFPQHSLRRKLTKQRCYDNIHLSSDAIYNSEAMITDDKKNADLFCLNEDNNNCSWDAFTKFGVRLWQPDQKRWVEISVLGEAYEALRPMDPRSGCSMAPNKNALNYFSSSKNLLSSSSRANELINGSIIDISGVSMLFQKPKNMARSHKIDPQTEVKRLNRLNPQCPVLMQSIEFRYYSWHEKRRKLIDDHSCDLECSTKKSNLNAAEFISLEDNRLPYVYPACGHVHGYSKALFDRTCPLCRTPGSFVSLNYPFEPTICNDSPTHVFNSYPPCGHAASFETCKKWASIPIPKVNEKGSLSYKCSCPFCGNALSSPPFSKLVIQTEILDESLNRLLNDETGDVLPIDEEESDVDMYSPPKTPSLGSLNSSPQTLIIPTALLPINNHLDELKFGCNSENGLSPPLLTSESAANEARSFENIELSNLPESEYGPYQFESINSYENLKQLARYNSSDVKLVLTSTEEKCKWSIAVNDGSTAFKY